MKNLHEITRSLTKYGVQRQLFLHFELPIDQGNTTKSRPSRESLVNRGIIPKLYLTGIREGIFINGPELRNIHDISRSLTRHSLQKLLLSCFQQRPTKADLVKVFLFSLLGRKM